MATPNLPDIGPTYGAVFGGLLFATFFQGTLTVQAYHYFSNYPDDPRWTKALVAILWTLDFAHLILIAYSVYYYLVLNWGNAAVLHYFIIPLNCHLLLLGLSTFLSQMFFLHRIWVFSQRNLWIVTPLFLGCLATFSLIVAVTTRLVESSLMKIVKGIPSGVMAWMTIGAISDLLIAALLCRYLHLKSRGARELKATNAVVQQLIGYTVATSALTSVVALGSLIAFIVSRKSYVYLGIHISSGRTFTNAILVNLNARQKFRETLMSGRHNTREKSLEFAVSSIIMPRPSHTQISTTESTYVSSGGTAEIMLSKPPKLHSSRFRYSVS